MIEIAKYNDLHVGRISDFGLYLADAEGNEVLLPNRFVSLANKVGDRMRVFVYHDSEDRPVASTEQPLATAGQAAFLKVVDSNVHGAFLDWGIKAKDLFVPKSNIKFPLETGRKYIFFTYVDPRSGRAVATTKLTGFVSNDNIAVKPGERVRILVAQAGDTGYRVVVNDHNWGMIYRNQIFSRVAVGDTMEAYVQKITDDNRIDLSLQPSGYDGVKEAAERLLTLLGERGGALPLGDGSDPAEVSATTGMSKKVFKRAVGYLLKRGEIGPDGEGIKLTTK